MVLLDEPILICALVKVIGLVWLAPISALPAAVGLPGPGVMVYVNVVELGTLTIVCALLNSAPLAPEIMTVCPTMKPCAVAVVAVAVVPPVVPVRVNDAIVTGVDGMLAVNVPVDGVGGLSVIV